MSNHEWDALAADWDQLEVGDPALLQRRVGRHLLWNRLGLLGEAFSLVAALGLIAFAWSRNPELRGWLAAAALVLVVCQGVYLVLRRRYRLFGDPGGGLVGLIDAEIRRARFVIATYCVGTALALLLLPLAWVLIPAEQFASGLAGIALGGGLSLAYMISRGMFLLRSIRRLRIERATLAE